MNLVKKIFIILFFMLFIACNKQNDENNIEVLKYNSDILIASEGEGYFLDNPKNIIKCNDFLYILDHSAPFIKIFNMGGKFIKSFGKKGKGPGEFLIPKIIKSYNDSLLYIYDWKRKSVIVYNADGIYHKSYYFNNKIKDMEIFKTDQIIYSVKIMNNIRKNEASDYKIFLYKKGKNILLDSIKIKDKIWFEKRKLLMSFPFVKRKFFYINNLGKLIIVDNGSFQFKIFNNVDLVSYNIKYYTDKKGPKINNRDKEEYFKTRIIVDPNGNRTTKLSPDIKNSIKFPKYKPRIASVLCDLKQNAWVKLNTKIEKYDKYKIFKDDGNYIKTVVIKKGLLKNPLIFNENYFLQKDLIDGLPVIKKYFRVR